MGILKGHFDKICRKAIGNYAKKKQIIPGRVEIVFFLEEIGTPGFMLLVDGKGKERVSAKKLLNVNFDFHNKAEFLQAKVAEILLEVAGTHKIDWNHILIIVRQEGELIKTSLWNNQVYMSELDLSILLNDEKLLNDEQISS